MYCPECGTKIETHCYHCLSVLGDAAHKVVVFPCPGCGVVWRQDIHGGYYRKEGR